MTNIYDLISDDELSSSIKRELIAAKVQGQKIDTLFNEIDISNQPKKRIKELRQTLKFITLLEEDVVFTSFGPDPPDMILSKDDLSIGLELTLIVNNKKNQKSGSIEDLLSKVEARYSSIFPNHLLHLLVSVKIETLHKSEIDTIANKIIEEIQYFIESGTVRSESIAEILIMAHNTSKFQIFPFFEADYEETITDDQVNVALFEKERKLRNYQNIYNECWLLLVLPDNFDVASCYSLPDQDEQQLSMVYNSKFDKVYLMGRSRLICLK